MDNGLFSFVWTLSMLNVSSERAALLGRETASVDAAYNTGASQLSSDLARRGVTDSSALSGGLSALASQRAAGYGQAASGARRYFDARQASAGQQFVQLLGGLESEVYSRQQAALGNQQAPLAGGAAALRFAGPSRCGSATVEGQWLLHVLGASGHTLHGCPWRQTAEPGKP